MRRGGGRHQGEDLPVGVRRSGRAGLAGGQRRAEARGLLLGCSTRLADRLVFAKIRERFGGRVRYFISGAAPLRREIAELFDAAGILILEGYGLTETSRGLLRQPARTVPVRHGRPAAARHRGPDRRRRRDPDQAARASWRLPQPARGDRRGARPRTAGSRTGDIGEIDADGFLRITDRKKDLIKTSGGKYVAPQPIEGQFKAICPLAGQIIVHGDGRNYVTALISLDPDAWPTGPPRTAWPGEPYAEVAASPELYQVLSRSVDELNARLPRWETIKQFAVLDHELSVEDGSLTPSLKLRRRVVEAQYAATLDDLYEG